MKIVEKTKEKDKKLVRIVKKIKKAEVKILRGDEWKSKDNLILRERKVYILMNNELRLEVIQLHHNILVVTTLTILEWINE